MIEIKALFLIITCNYQCFDQLNVVLFSSSNVVKSQEAEVSHN